MLHFLKSSAELTCLTCINWFILGVTNYINNWMSIMNGQHRRKKGQERRQTTEKIETFA
jgi:hypothetical protein